MMTSLEAIREMQRHLALLEQQKPSRKQIPQMLNLLKAILVLLERQEQKNANNLLHAIESMKRRSSHASRESDQ